VSAGIPKNLSRIVLDIRGPAPGLVFGVFWGRAEIFLDLQCQVAGFGTGVSL
jgi:hypothetical protein